MDYEKAYKDALQLARSYYDKGTNEFLDTIFPELAESEDEKIRKEMLAVINDLILPNEQMARFNAYLEKQKEHKPVISDEAIRDGVAHFGITQYQIDYWLKKHINVVEQKSAEKPNGEMVLDSYSRGYNDGYRSGLIDKNAPGTTEDNPIDPFDTKLFQDGVKEGRRLEREDMQKEQKPAEWSAYDENVLNGIIKAVEGGRLLTLVQLHWLKSLRPQPHWKPSEEQMKVDLEEASRNVYESWMGGTMDDVRRDIVELGKILNERKEESK